MSASAATRAIPERPVKFSAAGSARARARRKFQEDPPSFAASEHPLAPPRSCDGAARRVSCGPPAEKFPAPLGHLLGRRVRPSAAPAAATDRTARPPRPRRRSRRARPPRRRPRRARRRRPRRRRARQPIVVDGVGHVCSLADAFARCAPAGGCAISLEGAGDYPVLATIGVRAGQRVAVAFNASAGARVVAAGAAPHGFVDLAAGGATLAPRCARRKRGGRAESRVLRPVRGARAGATVRIEGVELAFNGDDGGGPSDAARRRRLQGGDGGGGRARRRLRRRRRATTATTATTTTTTTTTTTARRRPRPDRACAAARSRPTARTSRSSRARSARTRAPRRRR